MKDEISKPSDIFGLKFHQMSYLWVENLSKQTRNANQYVIFSGCFGTLYELQQIVPENSISFNYLVSELTWLH